MNTKMTLPKDSIVLTSTDRAEIDKVLRELVTKVPFEYRITEALSFMDFIYWNIEKNEIRTCNNTSALLKSSIKCSTADAFLSHFEKPNYIPLEFGSCGVIVYAYGDITFTNKKDGSIFTITSEELNQIVEAQKQLI